MQLLSPGSQVSTSLHAEAESTRPKENPANQSRLSIKSLSSYPAAIAVAHVLAQAPSAW
jgi:hypothetical protein